jgi:hypothetical protein
VLTLSFDDSDFLTPYEVDVSRVRLIRRACEFKFIVLLLISVGSRHIFWHVFSVELVLRTCASFEPIRFYKTVLSS